MVNEVDHNSILRQQEKEIDMSGIPLQAGIIYGPIFSRRLGRSLGINLLPINHKVCSFDCVYCQYGPATVVECSERGDGFPSATDVLLHIEKALKKPRTIDYLTFSGNGEPTLHPDFPEIVQGVVSLRNKLRPEVKLAILSNSSRVNDPGILSALQLLDAPMMKLDAGDEKTFRAINHPARSVDYWKMVKGLKQLNHLMIQSLFVDGVVTNVRGDAYQAWVELLVDLKPQEIHIYSIDRPTAFDGVEAVNLDTLEKIAADLRTRFNLVVTAF